MFVLQEVKTEDTLLNLLLREITKRDWVNEYDKPMSYICPLGKALKTLVSHHDNHFEDRRWKFECQPEGIKVKDSCKWHKIQYYTGRDVFGKKVISNKVGKDLDFQCPDNGILIGLRGDHHNSVEDRAFEFACCYPEKAVPQDCKKTDWQNNFDKDLSYTAPDGMLIRGIKSKFDSHYKDRRFAFEVCKMVE